MTLTNPWPGRGWPLTAAEEQEFVAVAAAHRGRAARTDEDEIARGVTRGDVTLLVTALRHGADLDQMLSVTPGLNVAALVRAHRHVERLLKRSHTAWVKLTTATVTTTTITKHAGEAAKLLPLSVARLQAALDSGQSTEAVLSYESSRIETLRRHFDQLGEQLGAGVPVAQVAALARQMYHPDEECLLQHPRFLPVRVAEISPLRLARLLGEQSAGFETPGTPPVAPKLEPSVAAARARPGRGRR